MQVTSHHIANGTSCTFMPVLVFEDERHLYGKVKLHNSNDISQRIRDFGVGKYKID